MSRFRRAGWLAALAVTMALLVLGRPETSAQSGLVSRTGVAQAEPGPAPPPVRTGTQRMRERLARILAETDPDDNRFLNSKHVESLRRKLARITEPANQIFLRVLLAEELLNAGRPQEAIAELEPLAAQWDGLRQFARPGTERYSRELLALAWLRVGEQANCILHHGAQSCIAPIEGGGVHRKPEGSRQAMVELRAILAHEPEDLKARWLLNIAAMTLGEWPDGVEARFRIGPEAFASDHDIGRFRDAAIRSGIRHNSLAGGVVTEDLDRDGDIDVLFSSFGLDASPTCFRNLGDGTFEDRSVESGLQGLTGGLNLAPADYDNDGDVDVLVLRGAWMTEAGRYPNSLLRNRGDGSFDDVTEDAGLLTFHPTQVGAWADYDNDGWLDLFVGNESAATATHPSELWRSLGDGTFEDRSGDLPSAVLGYVKGADWGDMDNDGRPDLVVSVFGARNVLLHNEGARPGGGWSFRDVSGEAGIVEPYQSFATWWFDYDNDGWEDILINGYHTEGVKDVAAMYLGLPNRVQHPVLYRNNHDGTFADVTAAVRLDRVALAMGANFGDLDNDGWLDAYFATGEPALASLMPNKMFRNDAGRAFQDVTTSGGFGHLQKGHAVSFVDIDQDGDQDVLTEMGGAFEGDTAYSVLFENPGHGNRWITLQLEGTRSNRCAFGARIRARVREPAGSRDIYLTAGTGGSFGASSLQQEMGLGQAAALEELEVFWPTSGIRQLFTGVAMDRVYRLEEGGVLEPVTVHPVRLGG